MKVERVPTMPLPPPPPAFNITGLTEDEAVFLRDLLGKFPCGGSGPKFHGHLYRELHALTEHRDVEYNFEIRNGCIREV